jgi:hypothetical protein
MLNVLTLRHGALVICRITVQYDFSADERISELGPASMNRGPTPPIDPAASHAPPSHEAEIKAGVPRAQRP